MCDRDFRYTHDSDHRDNRLAAAAPSSRRHRLWELPSHTHCPVIGVCLPMPVLRRVIGKALGNRPIADDYDFHVAAVAVCERRMPLSEALQRELDWRYAPTLRRFAQAKTTDALATLWAGALRGSEVAGALWATLSHARCEENLREQVCREIHMFQHQVGACNRVDLQRLEQLQEENAALTHDSEALKERHARTLEKHTAQVAKLNTELMLARGHAIARDSTIASLRDELAAFRADIPELDVRMDLSRRVELQRHRIHELERCRSTWQRRTEQAEERLQTMMKELAAARAQATRTAASPVSDESGMADLRDKAVLCVGGRTASVPAYRQLVEYTGGRFLHHDGGEENSAAQLEASLAAADLVICQTGCINHGAYWRVKDHCKRTGKRCVFVDKPSASSLARGLRTLGETDGDIDIMAAERSAPS